jgi:hypothetical protein
VGFFSCGAADPVPNGQVIAMITRAAPAAPATMSLTPRRAPLPVVRLICLNYAFCLSKMKKDTDATPTTLNIDSHPELLFRCGLNHKIE